MNNMNNRFAGRPKTSFILNLNHVDNTIEELSDVIDLNKNRHWMEAKSKLKVFAQKLNDLGKDSFEKKKVVNFHNFGPDPPLKSCENPSFIFFYSMTQKTLFAN